MAASGFAEAFGTALGTAFVFALVFGLLLLACMIATAAIVVLYGLRVATYATSLGVLIAALGGVVVWSSVGSGTTTLIAVVVAFLAGIGGGYVRWGSGSQGQLVEGTAFRVLLALFSFAGVCSGLLFWGFLLAIVGGGGLLEVLAAHLGELVVLLVITLAPVAAGGYVLRQLLFNDAI